MDRWFHTVRRQFVIDVLIENRGNQIAAAESLGIHRNTLYRIMREDQITPKMVREIRFSRPMEPSLADPKIYTLNIRRTERNGPHVI
jgi:hypothetical protein